MSTRVSIILPAILLLVMCSASSAQQPTPTPLAYSLGENEACELIHPPLTRIYVSVWDKVKKEYVQGLKYTDFEITVDDDDKFEIEYFIAPKGVPSDEDDAVTYTIGFNYDDFPRKKKWHKVSVSIRSPRQRDLKVISTPGFYH